MKIWMALMKIQYIISAVVIKLITETSQNQRPYQISAAKICEKSSKAAETRLTLNNRLLDDL